MNKHLIIYVGLTAFLQCAPVCSQPPSTKVGEQPQLKNLNKAKSKNSGWVIDSSYGCGGYYDYPQWQAPLESPKWEVSADKINILTEGKSQLDGNVVITYSQRQFKADHIRLLSDKTKLLLIDAKGHIRYSDHLMRIFGIQGLWRAQEDILIIKNPQYYYYPRHARGQAQDITLKNQQEIILNDASYTTCAPGKTTWELQGKHIELNKENGHGRAKHIRLKFKNTTIFYWPFLQFPIDQKRHSGFLYPQFGSTSQSGVELSIPYYWNIAPNTDLTVTPRVLTNRGIELQSEIRYLTRHSDGLFRLHFLPNDQKYQDFRKDNLLAPPIDAPSHDPRLTALEEGNHRLGLTLQHHSHWGPFWTFDVDYTYVSDDNYFYDLENDLHSASTTKVNQLASLRYEGIHWQHILRLQAYDLLHPLFGPVNSPDYRRLPQWAFNAQYPQVGPFDWALNGEITHFTHALDPLSGSAVTEGTRVHLKPGVSIPYERWWGFIKPRIQADALGYYLHLGDFDKSISRPEQTSRVIPIVDIDSGLYFDRFYKNGYQQTLEPRVYYLFVPLKDQSHLPNFDTSEIDFSFYQMFRDNRFIGRDRLGDTHQTTIALTTRILNHESTERLRLSIGEIFYFKDRRVSLCTPSDDSCLFRENVDLDKHFSPIITNISYTPSQSWTLSGGMEFNPNHAQADKGYASLQYAPKEHQAISMNYYWMRRNPFEEQQFLVEKPLHQADIGLFWPLNKRWDILGQYRYDIENKRMIEVLAGLEYDTCCLAFQMVGNRYLRPNDGLAKPDYANGIFFQVLFKGLSNVGSRKADDKLSKAIPRYKAFAKRNDIVERHKQVRA